MAIALLLAALWRAGGHVSPVAIVAALNLAASLLVWGARGRKRLRETEARSEQLAAQLDRRISELFSLQELSYILSESIQLDRIVDQVARYAGRFLQADGAIVVLAEDEQAKVLRIMAATGVLEPLLGRVAEDADSGLARFAIDRERIEVAQGVAAPTVNLIAGTIVRSAAVAPLRSQGLTMGVLAVADRQGGPFTTEDLWLLSTVATNASVVIANSRLYEMVRRSKEEWETAFDALTEGIAVVGSGGAVLRANRALAALADLSEQELIGRNFCEALFGGAEAAEALIDAAFRGERTAPLVARLERSQRVLRLTVAPLAERSATSPIVALVEDVTEQRLLEAQLIQNEKMASIGQLVSGVAHELNNPLTSIAGLTELLLERDPRHEVPREHLRVIHDQAERAGRIVQNLLTFARKGVPDKGPVDLNDVVSRTSLLIMYELQLHGIDLDTALSPEPVVVLGDRHELQQVLLNLVTNAVQAVSNLPVDRPRRIQLSTTRTEHEAILRVWDSGPGVPPHLVSYLFTPFFTTKGPGEGTGLGLSLSYGLVNAHGGVLAYEVPPEGGAEFRVTLPSHEGRVRAEGAAVGVAPDLPAAPRMLVVDDDPAVHRLVTALFAPDGFVVDAVRSGEAALRLAIKEDFSVILVDARAMAGTAELFVSALITAAPESGHRLIVAVSGDGDLPDPLPGRILNRVRKPFSLRDLHALVEEVLASNPPRSPAAREER